MSTPGTREVARGILDDYLARDSDVEVEMVADIVDRIDQLVIKPIRERVRQQLAKVEANRQRLSKDDEFSPQLLELCNGQRDALYWLLESLNETEE